MSHLSHDQLWAFAGGEASELERTHARGHLEGCPSCEATLSDIRVARGALALLPAAPELPRAVALRVGEALADRADARSVRSWFARLFEPRLIFAAVALVLLAGAALWLTSPSPSAPAPAELASRPAAPQAPSPAPTEPPPPPARGLTASVTSATRARAQNVPAARAQVLQQGAKVVTEAGGRVWLKLPDGSRAGLTGASSLTLATLEQATLTLELQHGSLAMEVPHRTDRLLTINAGKVLITDLGTRFVVSRNESRVLVGVQEGMVEVATPSGKQTVKAGHAVSWHDGKLDALTWEAGPERPAAAPLAAAAPPSKLHEEEETEGTPPIEAEPEPEEEPVAKASAPGAPATAPEEWALPRGLTARPPRALDPNRVLLPPVNVPRRRLSLRELELKLEVLSRAFAGVTMREARMRAVVHAADAGDCARALPMADQWLREPPTGLVDEYRWRRTVLTQKLHCLDWQHRTVEAQELRRLLDAP